MSTVKDAIFSRWENGDKFYHIFSGAIGAGETANIVFDVEGSGDWAITSLLYAVGDTESLSWQFFKDNSFADGTGTEAIYTDANLKKATTPNLTLIVNPDSFVAGPAYTPLPISVKVQDLGGNRYFREGYFLVSDVAGDLIMVPRSRNICLSVTNTGADIATIELQFSGFNK